MAGFFLLFHTTLVLAFAVLGVACLRVRGMTAHLLGLFVVAYADIVLALQAAGLLNAVNRIAVTSIQILFTAVAIALWLRMGRPPLLAPFASVRIGPPPWGRRFTLRLTAVTVVAAAVAYAYLLRAGVILATHPENYDALTYHLTRVGYWLQYQSFFPWPTPNLRQTIFPMNAELGILWTVLWWGSDRFSGCVQWITVPVIMLGIFGLGRLLGYSRWSSAMAGLLWATLPQVLYQASTTQNDLLTASFWVPSLYFLFAGLRGKQATLLYLSALSLGLAIGSKSTSLVALPGLALGVLAALWAQGRHRWIWRLWAKWIFACFIGFVLLGSYIYIQNTIAFRNPLGASSAKTGPGVLVAERGWMTYATRLHDNLGRYTYQLVDFSPLPEPVPNRLNTWKAALFGGIFDILEVIPGNRETTGLAQFGLGYINGLDENASWFGPLAILFMAAAAIQAYQGVRRRDALRLCLALFFVTFLVVHSSLQNWTPYKGRYYLVPMSVGFALVCMFLTTRSVWRAALAASMIALGLLVMFTVTRSSALIGGTGWSSILSHSRKAPSWENEFNYRLISEILPEDASIGLQSSDDMRDYPFFGEHFTHYLTLAVPNDERILPRTDISPFVTDFRNSDYLFLTRGGSPESRAIALQEFSLLSDDGANSLWIRQQLRSADTCDGNQWPFIDLVQSSTAAICPRFPILPGLTVGGASRTIFLRDGHFVPTIAAGSQGELGFDLLVAESTEAVISIHVVPRSLQKNQMLLLSLTSADVPAQAHSETFSGKSVLKFSSPLVRGAYQLRLRMAPGSSEASVLKIEVAGP